MSEPEREDSAARFADYLGTLQVEIGGWKDAHDLLLHRAEEEEQWLEGCYEALQSWRKGLAGYRFTAEYRKAYAKAAEIQREMRILGGRHAMVRKLRRECRRLRRRIFWYVLLEFVTTGRFLMAAGVVVALILGTILLIRLWPL